MAATIKIKRCITVECDDIRMPWVVESVELVDGIEFAKLSKRDYGFCKFVGGIGCRKIMHSWLFLHELQKLRTAATLKICIDSLHGNALFDNAPVGPAVKKRAKRDATAPPAWVDIDVPEVESSGIVAGATTLKVRASCDVRDAPWVELCPAALHYIKVAMLASAVGDSPDVLHGIDGVRWRKDRKCWLAVRPCDGNKLTKSFKPADRSPEAIQDTLNIAARWVGGEDVIDDGNCEPTDAQTNGDTPGAQLDDCDQDADEPGPVDRQQGEGDRDHSTAAIAGA